MKILAVLKSPLGNTAVFVAFLALGGLIYARNQIFQRDSAKEMTAVETPSSASVHTSVTRVFESFRRSTPRLSNNSSEPSGALSPSAEMSQVANTSSRSRGGPGIKPRVPPLSLIAPAKPANEDSELSKSYAPFGRMIPCETVITLESSKLDTPVVGLVTEDVWHNGRLVIPAGAEVHGRASLDRSRERIAASGRWVVVWRDGTDMNGTELILNGIALEREKNDTSGEFGLRDGSAGLIGDLLRTDDFQEIKLFASTFLAGVAGGLQQTQTQTTALGITQIATGSGRDAALRGTSDVLNAYARQIQDTISRDGFFVRVPAGKQFYIYVTETIDQAHGMRGNRSVEEIWKTHEK